MASGRIYRSGGVWKRILIVALVLVLLVVVVWVGVFFYFRRYVVYSDDSAYLEIPWLEGFSGNEESAEPEDESEAPGNNSEDPEDEDESEQWTAGSTYQTAD